VTNLRKLLLKMNNQSSSFLSPSSFKTATTFTHQISLLFLSFQNSSSNLTNKSADSTLNCALMFSNKLLQAS
jgi:hypothetical protein